MSILKVEKLNVSEFKGVTLSKEYEEWSRKVKEKYEKNNKECAEELPEDSESIQQEKEIAPPDIEFILKMYSQEYQNVEKKIDVYIDVSRICSMSTLIKNDNICKNFDVDSYFILYLENQFIYINGNDFDKVLEEWKIQVTC